QLTRIRRQGLPAFRLWPVGQRAEYDPVTYLEPVTDRNRAAFGFDLGADPVRREALERARDTGLPALSGVVSAVEGTAPGEQARFVPLVPFSRDTQPPTSVGRRRAALVGYVSTQIRLDAPQRDVLGAQPRPPIRFDLYDGAPSPEAVLFDSRLAADA